MHIEIEIDVSGATTANYHRNNHNLIASLVQGMRTEIDYSAATTANYYRNNSYSIGCACAGYAH